MTVETMRRTVTSTTDEDALLHTTELCERRARDHICMPAIALTALCMPCIAAMECTRSSRLCACRSSQQTRQRAACCLAISKSVVWYLGQAQG